MTQVTVLMSKLGWLLCVLGCWLFYCLLLFSSAPSYKNQEHTCTQCNQVVGFRTGTPTIRHLVQEAKKRVRSTCRRLSVSLLGINLYSDLRLLGIDH